MGFQKLRRQIIRIGLWQPKTECIRECDAIFVDDSFRERTAVSEKLGIPSFDCSMIEMCWTIETDAPKLEPRMSSSRPESG
jgi:hypothetical protein